mgnify:CR=1 FL=1
MHNRPNAVMLFAAGFGTRMGALTATRPKPLIAVAGRPLIDHALAHVRDYGASRVVVNTHYLGGQIAAHLADSEVLISDEQPDILDTGGGLRAALPLLGDGPVITMNTDAVFAGPNPLHLLARAWADAAVQDGALLLCIAPARALAHDGAGDFTLLPDGRARRGGGAIYTGVQILHGSEMARMPAGAFSLNLLWDALLAEGRLRAILYSGRWCDVGHPEGVATADSLLGHDDV